MWPYCKKCMELYNICFTPTHVEENKMNGMICLTCKIYDPCSVELCFIMGPICCYGESDLIKLKCVTQSIIVR